ncbi:MAG: UbiA prenyltransferase [Acidimicrobiaceae bacterium]|nr:UbiA prenyltransferase [Acidimicrobiaceae bacterium]
MDERATHPSERRHLRPVSDRAPRLVRADAPPAGDDAKGKAGTRSLGYSLLVAMRPRQWVKNLLVVAAPAAAGELGRAEVLARTAATAGLFLLASAGTYLVNDVIDAPADRVHPDKRHRPIASGELPLALALALGGTLLVAAVVGAGLLGGAQLAGVVGAYVLISTAYSLWLKRFAVIELACVASGFVLRAVAGGAAVHIPISPWFAIVTSAAALLVVAGKRSTELDVLGAAGASHRRVLDEYSKPYLRSVRMIGAAVAIVSYGLWAFQRAAHIDLGPPDAGALLLQISIVPFVLGVLTVELAIESGKGGAPEELVFRNHTLQVLGLSCVALVAAGIYT